MTSESEETRINAGLWRTSLKLRVQNNAVFIVSYDAHGPWNIIEGQGRNMTNRKTRHAKSAALGGKHS